MHCPVRRIAVCLALIGCWLLPASAALASGGQLTGRITYIGSASVTIQTVGRQVGRIDALSRGADALSADAYPYVWGGGHGEAGVASIGIEGGPGYNGHRIGYDCSGAVAAVLAAAGLWPAGSPVPNDAGVIRTLRRAKLITRGAGTAPDEVTLYDDPGVHIFININGRFFGTSDGGAGDFRGSPTWLSDVAPDASRRTFRQWHFLPSVLADRTTSGQSYTFATTLDPGLIQGTEIGDTVTIGYAQAGAGAVDAQIPVSGTVAAIGPDGASVS
jgi:hypothetical protein